MPAKRLTDRFVATVRLPKKDGDRQVRFIDTMERGLALVLKVSYGGSKAWSVLTYRNGKPVTFGLGRWPEVTLKQAREEARAYHRDPDKVTNAAAVGSFKEVAERWFAQKKAGHRTAKESHRHLTAYIYPRWADRKFLDIRRRDVADLLDLIESDSGPRQADMVLSTISLVCQWWQSRDSDYVSPIVRGMKRSTAKSRERILTDDEIRAVWKATAEGTFGGFVRLALLTGQRKDKLKTLRWTDVSDDGIWTISSEDAREKKHGGVLRLTEAAVKVIRSQPRVGAFVFSGARHGRPFADFAGAKRALDARADVTGWTIHDLRRSARSLMSRAGVPREHAEQVLGHAIPGVAGVYDRHSYQVEKDMALGRLAAEIERIVGPTPPANVTFLRKK